MSCSVNGNLNFPVTFTGTISEQTYKDVETGFKLDVKWGSRTTSPTFQKNDATHALLDEGGVNSAVAPTTVLYNGKNYILQYAQLHKPLHKSFVLPVTEQANINVELSLFFELSMGDDSSVKGIWVSVPIIGDATIRTDPLYFSKMVNSSILETTGLYSLMPGYNQNRFVQYQTCIVDPNNTTLLQSVGTILVFASIYGLRVSTKMLADLKAMYNPSVADWPNYLRPTLLPEGMLQGSVIGDNYKSRMEASWRTITPQGVTGYVPVATDTLDSYKCVQLDPDADVKDGTIQINMETGEPLNQTLDNRKALMTAGQTETAAIKPGQVERFFANAVGIFLAVGFALIVFYLGFVVIGKRLFPNMVLPEWLRQSPMYILIGFIFGFVGFLIGTAAT